MVDKLKGQIILISGVCFLIFLAVLAILLYERVPPFDVTKTNLSVIRRRIINYVELHGEFPEALKDLEPLSGFSNDLFDGWGNQFHARRNGSEIIVWSDGADFDTREGADSLCITVSKSEAKNRQENQRRQE